MRDVRIDEFATYFAVYVKKINWFTPIYYGADHSDADMDHLSFDNGEGQAALGDGISQRI